MVFQILPVRVVTTLVIWIITATFCHTEKRFTRAITIINVINGISAALCILSIIQVYKRLRTHLAGHQIVFKLGVLKTIVGLEFIQRAVFSGLNTNNDLKGTTHVSSMDWQYGIPNFITVCEMFIFALLFIAPYSWTPYTRKPAGQAQKLPFFLALLQVWNVIDIFAGVLEIFKLGSRARDVRAGSYSAAGPGMQQVQMPNKTYQRENSDVENYGGNDYGRNQRGY
jgi:Organic solute transporter Ostalpha